MTPEKTDEAAAILLSNWQAVTRIDALPEDCRPADRAGGSGCSVATGRHFTRQRAGQRVWFARAGIVLVTDCQSGRARTVRRIGQEARSEAEFASLEIKGGLPSTNTP